MNENPDQEPARTELGQRIPPLAAAERFHCPICGGAIAPELVHNVPFIIADRVSGSVFANPKHGRILALPCEHCAKTTMYRLVWSSELWRHDTKPATLNGTDARIISNTINRMKRGAA